MHVVICQYSATIFTARGGICAGLVSFFEGMFRLVDVWVGFRSFLVLLGGFSSGLASVCCVVFTICDLQVVDSGYECSLL